MENDNYTRAKEIYMKYPYEIVRPDNLQKEFDSYNVPQEIITKWHNEYLEDMYYELLDHLNDKTRINEYDSSYYTNDLKLILRYFPRNEKNFIRIVEAIEKLHEVGFFVREMEINDLKYDYFFKFIFLCDKRMRGKDTLRELFFHSEHNYCGFLEMLYSQGYIDLYNRLMIVFIESIKEGGVFFQFFIKDLLGYLEFINDEYHLNEVKQAINMNKEKGMTAVLPGYGEYTWEM